MEPPAIGPKMKMMEQKVFLKLLKMCSGSMMTTYTHGIREGSKEDPPDEAKVKAREKEKEKAEEAENSSGQDEKEKAKAEEKAAFTWWEKKDMKMNGKKKKKKKKKEKKKNGMIMAAIGPKNKNGAMPIGAQKNCTTRMSMVCSREKEKARKVRKERKERTMNEKTNEEMAKASQTMCSHPLHRINQFRINLNRFITQVLFHRVQGMVLFLSRKLTQYVLMYWMLRTMNRELDATVEQVKMSEVLGRKSTERE